MKYNKKHLLLQAVILLLLGFYSCKDKKVREAEKLVNEWMGKEILFPASANPHIQNRDTLCPELFEKDYKILLYVDTTGCTDCKLGLRYWSDLIKEADSLAPGKVGFLFYFYPKNEKELYFLMKRDGFDYPVFIDSQNEINRLNQFSKDSRYQSFLLDKGNRVLSIGNPKQNPMIWKLYKQIITENKAMEETALTTVKVQQATMQPENLQVGKTKKVVFSLQNTGNQPLVISKIHSSCGCTVPHWDKQPHASGKTTEIQVEVKPESDGYFHKTIDVFCNTENSPVRLTVKGEVRNIE